MISNEEQFEDSPRGWQSRWTMEFKAAKDAHADWQKKGQEIVDRFLDKRMGKNVLEGIDTRWNFYTANVQTQKAMLYGKPPSVDVRPRFADAPDTAARIAGEILERVLNSDLERDKDGFKDALDQCLMDRLNPGLGFMRFRYCVEMERVDGKPAVTHEETGQELAPEVPESERKSEEEVETDYIHWKDILWSTCRTYKEMRWCAFRAQLSREQLEEKFGEMAVKTIALNTIKDDTGGTDAKKADPWSRADVWEIWDKEHGCVWFFIEGQAEVLKPVNLDGEMNKNGSQKDPLGLDNFWPFAKPMVANLTTSAFVPRADFVLCQDLYDEIDRVSTRITELERAIGAKGVYDKNAGDSIGRLLTETSNNQLLPVENFSSFAEKGGLKGCFDLLPLDGLVLALDKLRDYRNELIQISYQLTGMSDIMRGQAAEVSATATEQSIKAKFASVRMQALQDELARFASESQAVRAEIIAKHFEPQTILERSNILHSFEAEAPQLILQAIQLIKDDHSSYRVEVKPEAISLSDFAALKAERTEVLAALGGFFQSCAPVVQAMPGSLPHLLKILQWSMQGLRGASTIETVLDQAITQAQQAAQQPQAGPPPPPDPKLMVNQQKAQADIQKLQLQNQLETQRMVTETQQLAQRKEHDAQVNIQTEMVRQKIKQGGVGPVPGPGVVP